MLFRSRMFRHGFTRFKPFARVLSDSHQVTWTLVDDEQTRAEYPFAFRLTLDYELSATTLDVGFAVENRGPEPMPYAAGFHPAFNWPFADGAREDYRVEFDADEAAAIPAITATGLVRSGAAAALVTGPIAKSRLARVGFDHPGQTEFVAEACGVTAENAVMMLAGPSLKVVPITVHVALRLVPDLLTAELIRNRAAITAAALARD